MQTFVLEKLMLSGRWLSFAMLVTLHIALWVGTQSLWMRPLLLMHLGLFLLWQPLWRGERKLHTGAARVHHRDEPGHDFSAELVGAGVLGQRVVCAGRRPRIFAFHARWQRVYYLLMMAYLLAILVLYIAPNLFRLARHGRGDGQSDERTACPCCCWSWRSYRSNATRRKPSRRWISSTSCCCSPC